MLNKEGLRAERAFASEVMKIFEWSHPRINTPEMLYRKAEQLRHLLDREEFKRLDVVQALRGCTIDQLKDLCRVGMVIWERERARGMGRDTDPLHILKTTIVETAKVEEVDKIFGKIKEAL